MPATDDNLDHLPTLRPDGSSGAVELSPVHPPEAEELDYAPTLRGLRAGLKVFGMRYQLVRQLGRGGMGVVWLARDGKLDLDVALKFLPEGLQDDLVAVEELRSETKRCLQLTHPLIVRTYDLVEGDGMTAIAMEFIQGQTLNELRMQQPAKVFETAVLQLWLQQLCEALTYAHTEARLVHRDLKPSNVMISTSGRLKLADFGIASGLSDTMSRLTRAGANPGAGTLVYMSPQQVMGFPPTVTDDIYSLGATLYELITGKPPFFRGSIERQIETMVPPSMVERRQELGVKSTAEIPEAWERLVAACLEKEKDKRPQSAAAVWELLVSAPVAKPPVKLEPSPAVKITPPIVPPPPTPTQSPGRKGVLGLAAVLIVSGFGYWMLVSEKESPPPPVEPVAAIPLTPTAEELHKPPTAKRTEEIEMLIQQAATALQDNALSVARSKLDGVLALEPANLMAKNLIKELEGKELELQGYLKEKQTIVENATQIVAWVRRGEGVNDDIRTKFADLISRSDEIEETKLFSAAKKTKSIDLVRLSEDNATLSSLKREMEDLMQRRVAKTSAVAAMVPPAAPAPAVVFTPPPPVEPTLPASGYFPLDQLFDGTSYDSYNTYSRSQILTKAQEKLKTAGLYQSTADGSIGPGTQQAIMAYQRQRGLPVTGKLDSATQSSMSLGGQRESSPPAPRPATPKPKAPAKSKSDGFFRDT